MKPEELEEQIPNLEFVGTEMVKGVEFAKYEDAEGHIHYHLVYPSGKVEEQMSLSEVYSSGNLTLAKTTKDAVEVMVDDDGIHYEW